MPHAYPFEALQLIGALIGMGFNVYALVQARKDAEALITAGVNGTRKIVATGNIQQELLRLIVQVLLVVIGAVSIVLPPPNPDVPQVFMWSGYITRVVLLLITFLLAFKSMLDVKDRRMLMRLWLTERERRHAQEPIAFPDRRRAEPRIDTPDRRRE